MDTTRRTFKTSDLYYAAFLKTAGFDLADIVKSETSNQKFFIFEDSSGLIQKTRTDYINDIAKVSAKNLIDNIRGLKTLINME